MSEDNEETIWVGGACIKNGQVLLVHRINHDAEFNKEYFVFPGKEVSGDETRESALENAFKDFSMTVSLGEILYAKDEDVDDQEYYYSCKHIIGEPAVAQGSNERKAMEEGSQEYTPMWVRIQDLDDLIVYPETVKEKIIENVSETQ